MRTYILRSGLLIAVVSLFFFSCGKDNTDIVNNKSTAVDTAQIISPIGGMRYWKGNTTYSQPIYDTFEVVPYHKDIEIKSTVLELEELNTDLKTVSFRKTLTVSNVTYFHQAVYYYEQDSISYTKATSVPMTSESAEYLHTYHP